MLQKKTIERYTNLFNNIEESGLTINSYLKTIGIVTKIDEINKCIFVVKNKILIDDIIDIKIISDSLDF